MKLFDRIAQCRTPFVVRHSSLNTMTRLSGANDYASEMIGCATRFVLSDDLTRLCTALAYSKGARTFGCADLLHIPAERVWIEWCEAPWHAELALYGFGAARHELPVPQSGRRGALIHASRDGRRGWLRTFWATGDSEFDLLASAMEGYFDFDTPENEAPEAPDGRQSDAFTVADHDNGEGDLLHRFFRFRYEQSWSHYYESAALEPHQRANVARHALGTVAVAVPVLLAFFLLLGTRTGLPRREFTLDRINRSRTKAGKPCLLEHVEVLSPLLPYSQSMPHEEGHGTRRTPRYHHVRGHIVRRGDQIFWRVPHARGNARAGIVRSRTVTWTVDALRSRQRSEDALATPPA